MVSLEEAVGMLQTAVKPISEVETVALSEASGRILAHDIIACYDQPPFPRSPLDGYAVKGEETKGASKETPVTLKVVGKIYAGQVFSGIVGPGECIRIMTGAPIPEGADAVIRQEDTDFAKRDQKDTKDREIAFRDPASENENSNTCSENPELVRIYKGSTPYSNYCYAGEDYKCGDVLVGKGQKVNGSRLGIIAGTGKEEIEVYREPRIAVISTGDEIISPGQPIKPGKIYDSNRYLVYGRLKDLGMSRVSSFHCPDEANKMITAIIDKAADSDLIITTGGVSVGEKDIMHEVLKELEKGRQVGTKAEWNAKKLFWKVNLKPGAPTIAFVLTGQGYDRQGKAWTKEVLVVCLTGNPYGVAVNFELLIRPVLAALTGNDAINYQKKLCILENDSPKRGGRRRFMRGYLLEKPEGEANNGDKVRILTGNHASGTLSSLDRSNCLVEIGPEGSGKAGDRVWVYPF